MRCAVSYSNKSVDPEDWKGKPTGVPRTMNVKRIAAFAAFGLLAATWLTVVVVGAFFEPSKAVWIAIVTAAAIATEVALWLGATIAGITLFEKLRARLRLRRS
jgi:hypothetical protein